MFMKKKWPIFITGGTGFVGSHIAMALLKRGHKLTFLARPQKKNSAVERICTILQWHNCDEQTDLNIEIIEGDLSKPLLGLDEYKYNQLVNPIDEIWHSGGNTSFDETNKELLDLVNIRGTESIGEIATAGSCKKLNYISTAYSVGRVKEPCGETIVEQDDFFNHYERTKYDAEKILVDKCKNTKVVLNIFRPSIVIGDSLTGRTLLFNALYYPIKVIDFLRTMFLRDIKNKEGRNAREMGIFINDDGQCVFPLRINTGEESDSAINLVTIDYVVDACMAINDNMREGGIYNLTNNSPTKISDLTSFVNRYLNLTGVTTASDMELQQNTTALEKQFNSRIDVYIPYMQDKRIFCNEMTESFLKQRGILCSKIDYSILKKCTEYAIENKWKNPLLKLSAETKKTTELASRLLGGRSSSNTSNRVADY
jgi:nucleoside-diphosphate-sugar epimerase